MAPAPADALSLSALEDRVADASLVAGEAAIQTAVHEHRWQLLATKWTHERTLLGEQLATAHEDVRRLQGELAQRNSEVTRLSASLGQREAAVVDAQTEAARLATELQTAQQQVADWRRRSQTEYAAQADHEHGNVGFVLLPPPCRRFD